MSTRRARRNTNNIVAAGARALTCRRTGELTALLCAAPRCALHTALAERGPSDYCAAPARRRAAAQQLPRGGAQPEQGGAAAGEGMPAQMGIAPGMEDAAIAYRLLLEVRRCAALL